MLAHWQPDALAADVLVVGHHGSRTSSGQAFYRTVRPREAGISAGYRKPLSPPSPGGVDAAGRRRRPPLAHRPRRHYASPWARRRISSQKGSVLRGRTGGKAVGRERLA